MPSARPMSACSQRSLRAWAWPRERAALRRDEAPAGRDRCSARPSWRSSTRSARPLRSSSISTRSSTWSASALSEILDAATSTSPCLTPASEPDHVPVRDGGWRAGADQGDIRAGRGLTSRIIEVDSRYVSGRRSRRQALGLVWVARHPRIVSGVPILAGDEVLGVSPGASTARMPTAKPMSALFSTLASSMGVALENARLFDETKRLLAETDERAAELAIINSVQQGLAAEARHAGDVRPGRRQDPGDLRCPGRRHRDLRPGRERDAFPLHDRAGRSLPGRVDRRSIGFAQASLETRRAAGGQRRHGRRGRE